MRARGEIVLVVDDDAAVAKVLQAALSLENIAVECASSAEDALRALEHRLFDAVLSDVRMPGASGLDLLSTMHKRWPDTPVILITAHGSVRMAVAAMKDGAVDFLTKPFDIDDAVGTVRRALALSARRHREVPAIPASSSGLATRSPAMQEAWRILQRAARSDCTVLVLGESGVGKEVAVRFLHERSRRADKPFVAVHCAALPDALLESELFGYERGAFTGASTRKPGRLELAEGGTLFLDEIGDTSPSTQVKLLRVLQERTYERLGGLSTIKANVRFVAATHRDIGTMVEGGAFREDLFYRLSVCPVRLPPLRERREDVIPFVEHFARLHGQPGSPVVFEPAALDLLADQPWPGNVRQLQNLVERMVLLSDGPTIGREAVGEELARGSLPPPPLAAEVEAEATGTTLEAKRRDAERDAVTKALERAGGNRTKAARVLGVSRRTLYNKLAEYGLA